MDKGKKIILGGAIATGAILIGRKIFAKGEEGMGATLHLEILDTEGNVVEMHSPADLQEEQSYVARATVHNISKSMGIPVGVIAWGIRIEAKLDGNQFYTESKMSGFGPDETKSFDFAFATPVGSAGKSGTISGYVQSPDIVSPIASASIPISIIGAPVVHAASIMVGKENPTLMRAPVSGSPGEVFTWADEVWYLPVGGGPNDWIGWSRTAPEWANNLKAVSAGSLYLVKPNIYIAGQTYGFQIVVANKSTKGGVPIDDVYRYFATLDGPAVGRAQQAGRLAIPAGETDGILFIAMLGDGSEGTAAYVLARATDEGGVENLATDSLEFNIVAAPIQESASLNLAIV